MFFLQISPVLKQLIFSIITEKLVEEVPWRKKRKEMDTLKYTNMYIVT